MSTNRITRALLVLLALGAGVLLPAHAGVRGKGPKKRAGVPFTVIASGQDSNINSLLLETAVLDQDHWELLWAQHAGGTPPAVQFDRDMVVAVFLGMRGPQYSVYIDRVSPLAAGGYVVEYVEQEIRHKNRVFDDIITTPFVIAVLPRTDGPIGFSGTKIIVKRAK
ncbi:MAG: hypothetical protein ACYTGV_03230 [Planctomycetota bacterium]